jgi:hypothetical protein
MKIECASCRQPIEVKKHRIKAKAERYCMSCWTTRIPVGSKRENWGYVEVKTESGWMLEHRHVMEISVGRRLTATEHVHHLDRNKTNNDPSNLVLCASVREHLDTYHKGDLKPPPRHHNGRRRKDGTMPVGLKYKKRCDAGKRRRWTETGGNDD